MQSKKQLGIWMDHSTANIMDLSNDKVETITLESTPAFPEQVQNLRMDESLMHNKEQNQTSDFFKKLSHIIIDYDEVLLFGPTNAKTELFNMLKDNRQFEKIKIHVQSADNLTDNQQEAFVKDFFNTQSNF
ncbi:MAG: hypothetical protein GX126_06275 [Bacteroidales bacterium]|nr:hypothetical protein [Bacteroidales bacterium]